MEEKMSDMIGCSKCGKSMPAERLEFGFHKCSACTPQTKPKGVMVYTHKTGGFLETTDNAEVFRDLRGSADESVESL
jgi:ribosomal protein L37AE/L43A